MDGFKTLHRVKRAIVLPNFHFCSIHICIVIRLTSCSLIPVLASYSFGETLLWYILICHQSYAQATVTYLQVVLHKPGMGRVLERAICSVPPLSDWSQRSHFAVLRRSGEGDGCVKLDIDLKCVCQLISGYSSFSGLRIIDLSESCICELQEILWYEVPRGMFAISQRLVEYSMSSSVFKCVRVWLSVLGIPQILVDRFSFVWTGRECEGWVLLLSALQLANMRWHCWFEYGSIGQDTVKAGDNEASRTHRIMCLPMPLSVRFACAVVLYRDEDLSEAVQVQNSF